MPSAEEVLRQMGDDYKNAPRFNNWQPPVGSYIETIDSVEVGYIGKPGEQIVAVKVTGTIQDGEHEGKSNSLGVFTSKNFGMLADLVTALGGEDQPNALDAANFIRTKIGCVVQVEVKSSPNKKGGAPWINANVVGLVQEAAAAESTEAPPA